MRLVLGLRNGERVDIVAAAREQADDAGQDARLVVDDDGKRMRLGRLLAVVKEIGRGRLLCGHACSSP